MKKIILLAPALFLVLACRDRTPDQPDLRVIAEGAALHGANGINFGPDGNLYVASVFGTEIVAMNPGTGQTVDRLGPEAGVEGPDDLVFGPDGSLYWTDIMKGEVGRRTPGGVVTKQMVAPGVNPITFSPDGRLFVALDFLGDGLYELGGLRSPSRLNRTIHGQRPWLSPRSMASPTRFPQRFDGTADGTLPPSKTVGCHVALRLKRLTQPSLARTVSGDSTSGPLLTLPPRPGGANGVGATLALIGRWT
jgi:hypothetical protein